MRNAFAAAPDPRTKLETIVRPDTGGFGGLHDEALYGAGGYNDANVAISAASKVIDAPNPQSYTFWSRNTANAAWFLRPFTTNAILSAGC
jgi:hypothetical protein